MLEKDAPKVEQIELFSEREMFKGIKQKGRDGKPLTKLQKEFLETHGAPYGTFGNKVDREDRNKN